ncbi:MAG TPA: trypsin-like peptidase domain-containing protein [Thermomicrobiales bacterium]|nr:trypsin-like peptidase domain-containing protein [Thermomicrobiales bacterium]
MRDFLIILAAVFLLVGPAQIPARAQADPAMLGHAIDAVVQLSIVVHGVVDGDEQLIWYAVGSGTVISPDGLILTNHHLITPAGIDEKLAELDAQLAAEGKSADLQVDAERLMIAVSDGRHLPDPRYMARVIAEDADLDLAILRIDSDERGTLLDPETLDLPVLPLGSSDAVNLGEAVHVFGFPAIGSGSLTYTTGIVSGFLFEEGIDGTAWINTDAVTSGGNSGGAAVNDAGQLIGVPTSGSSLDCRVGDTNRDGVVGEDDVGCVPTGGSLTQLRPIDLARPLLASVDAKVAEEAGLSAAASPATARDDLTASLSAAAGCAARGDWRCAANFYDAARARAPDDPAIATWLYDAYLELGRQEAAAGRLESARSAFAGAIAIDASRPDATMAVARIAPYRRAIVVDGFDGPERFIATTEGDSTSSYSDSAFSLHISEPGLVSSFPLSEADDPLNGQNFAALLQINEASGDGMVTIETRTDPAGGQWVFAVDPTRQTWEVLQFDTENALFATSTGPFAYGTPGSPQQLETVELRVRDGVPLLLVNGVDVAAAAGTVLPEIGNRGEVGFGALMASEGKIPFSVSFGEIALYELA